MYRTRGYTGTPYSSTCKDHTATVNSNLTSLYHLHLRTAFLHCSKGGSYLAIACNILHIACHVSLLLRKAISPNTSDNVSKLRYMYLDYLDNVILSCRRVHCKDFITKGETFYELNVHKAQHLCLKKKEYLGNAKGTR